MEHFESFFSSDLAENFLCSVCACIYVEQLYFHSVCRSKGLYIAQMKWLNPSHITPRNRTDLNPPTR